MKDAIIVLNAGSSSLKFSIFRVQDSHAEAVARGQIEGLGTSPRFKAKDSKGASLADENIAGPPSDFRHEQGFRHVARWAREQFAGELMPIAVGHRVVHGGLQFIEPVLIDQDVISKLEQIIPLVPLHQPYNLAAIKGVMKLRPDLKQVACFDTAFHRGRAQVTERFGLPDDLFQRGLRRWGFHGLSYESIAGQFRKLAPDLARQRVIVAHLGNGASMCAMKDCRSVDSTMGFSALDGLPMGTRCGTLDPGVVLFLAQKLSCEQIENLLYRKSGLLGISGISNDVRELLASKAESAANAIEYFVYRAVREIGSLTASLGGLDALIFTAGIGENSPVIRGRICRALTWLGVHLDPDLNERGIGCISARGVSPQVWVIPTDEEAVIAAGTLAVLEGVRELQHA